MYVCMCMCCVVISYLMAIKTSQTNSQRMKGVGKRRETLKRVQNTHTHTYIHTHIYKHTHISCTHHIIYITHITHIYYYITHITYTHHIHTSYAHITHTHITHTHHTHTHTEHKQKPTINISIQKSDSSGKSPAKHTQIKDVAGMMYDV